MTENDLEISDWLRAMMRKQEKRPGCDNCKETNSSRPPGWTPGGKRDNPDEEPIDWSAECGKNRLRAGACCRARSGIESGASRAAAVDAYYEPKTPFVICDTRDQIMQVLAAVRARKVKKKLDEFVKAAGPKDEPGCLYSDIGPTLFGASEHVGVLFDNDRAINLACPTSPIAVGNIISCGERLARKLPSERAHEAARCAAHAAGR
jgi:hypothetical protein